MKTFVPVLQHSSGSLLHQPHTSWLRQEFGQDSCSIWPVESPARCVAPLSYPHDEPQIDGACMVCFSIECDDGRTLEVMVGAGLKAWLVSRQDPPFHSVIYRNRGRIKSSHRGLSDVLIEGTFRQDNTQHQSCKLPQVASDSHVVV